MANILTINDLKAALRGGAKTDKYLIEIGTPVGSPDLAFTKDDIVLVHAASFPARNIGVMNAWVQGRPLKIPGDSSFEETWNITAYQTPDHSGRKKFIQWMDKIDSYINNFHTSVPNDFMVQIRAKQLDQDGNITAEYLLHNCFPTNVGEIELDSKTPNELQSYAVQFTYSHWEISV